MLFDSTLLFWHAGASYAFTSGEFVSLVGQAGTSTSAVINLGNPRDLGIGTGQETPQLALSVGAGFTSSSATLTINFQFQGSTDSNNWTTYVETGAMTTASFAAGSSILPIAVPRRTAGSAIPSYYRINAVFGANAGTAALSTGTIIGGIVLERADSAGTLDQYPAGFTVA